MAELRQARFAEPADGKVRCRLCPWQCLLAEGGLGKCGARKHVAGTLRSLNYGRVTAVNLDPIEKKPLYHFFPGSVVLSLGTFGCNLACSFCQNWEIAQTRPPTGDLLPEGAVALAEEERERHGNLGLAYTYNEPFIWYEFVEETAGLAQARGLKNVLVTNGMVEEAPLRELLPLVDAMNVDVKFWSQEGYRKYCGGPGWRARDTVEMAKAAGCHVEITTLIVPGANDTEEELGAICAWAAAVDPAMPLHLSRYHPAHRLSVPATPAETMGWAYELARAHLRHVYVGNLTLPGTADTECAECGAVLAERSGFDCVLSGVNEQGRCRSCGAAAPFTT